MKYPNHPILTGTGQYSVEELKYVGTPWGQEEHFLELLLKQGTESVRLKFLEPTELVLNTYFPTQLGLEILDVSSNQWENIKIEVNDYEHQSLHFFAKDVIRI